MSIAALIREMLNQTCVVTPRGDTITDADNQPVPSYPTPTAGVPCRLVDLSDDELLNARVGGATLYTDALLVPADAPIAPRAMVKDVAGTDADGDPVTIDAGPFEVHDVKRRNSTVHEFSRALIRRVG